MIIHRPESPSITVGILTVSGPAASSDAKPAAADVLRLAAEKLGWKVEVLASVAEEERQIRASLVDLCLENRVDLVLTVGGTGLGAKDITPEVTKSVLEKDIPGLAELIRSKGGRKALSAALSRGVAGTRRRTVIVNLPGSPKAALEAFHAAADLLPHAVGMLRRVVPPSAP